MGLSKVTRVTKNHKVSEHFQKAWIPEQLLTVEICKEGSRVQAGSRAFPKHSNKYIKQGMMRGNI